MSRKRWGRPADNWTANYRIINAASLPRAGVVE
jgi:hypothetical protein